MSTTFLTDYPAARADFLAAAREAGARLVHHIHPLRGRQGEELAVDTAWLGPVDAGRVLVTFSATHGVEGIYGSACQRTHLRRVAREGLPPGQALLVVHAVNPHGYSWMRRVDHQNIDLNRNQVDFSRPLPSNPGYAEVHRLLDALDLTPEGLMTFERDMRGFLAREGRAAILAVTGGQYSHPDGIFYGGQAPSWSLEVMRRIAQRWLPQARAIALLDHHTGLGPRGHTEIICRHALDSESLALARQWFGADVTAPAAGESESAVLDGNLRHAFVQWWCPQALSVAVGLEVGTQSDMQVLGALVADNWLHHRGDPSSPAGSAIRRQMQEAFYGDDEVWRARVLQRSMDLHDAAQEGLAALALPTVEN